MDNLEEESFYRCLQPSKNVGLDDVKGLENALQELRTHVELPLTRPELFQGTRSPERSLLLCGPPGTGKTMLIQAFSKEVNCTFLPISVSSLVSASPSTLQSLFRYAENHAPALVFFDEIDVLSYDSVNSRLENLKTELLSLCEQCPQGIVVIGATAYPWRMEPRFRRRFERRVWVEMPNTETRKEIAKELVKDGECVLSDTQLKTIADMTEGYTGADILSLIRDVLA